MSYRRLSRACRLALASSALLFSTAALSNQACGPSALTCTWTCVGAGTCTASGSGNINGTVNMSPAADTSTRVTFQVNESPGVSERSFQTLLE